MKPFRTASVISRLGATLLSLGFLYLVYSILDSYDWGYPHIKFACFAALFIAIVNLELLKRNGAVSRIAVWVEVFLLSGLLLFILSVNLNSRAETVSWPPYTDVGATTVHAVWSLVNEGENPYSKTNINHEQKNLSPEYHGFHYGPFMMAGYLPSAFLGPYAFKMMSIIFVVITAILLMFLAAGTNENGLEELSNALFVLTAYFMSERFWHEFLRQGVNDVFHIMLLLGGFLALKNGKTFLTGLLTGLSISAKFAPGVFAVPFMPVRQKEFWFGLLLGLTPYVPFFLWDAPGIWRNAVWLRVIIPYNSTSLYSVTPPEIHWLFGAVTLVSCLIAALWAIRRELSFESALVGFTLLMIVTDMMQKQVHMNHIIWFLPFLALLFLKYRDRLAGGIASGDERLFSRLAGRS